MDKVKYQYCCMCGKEMWLRDYDLNTGKKVPYDRTAVCSLECTLNRRRREMDNKSVKIKVSELEKLIRLCYLALPYTYNNDTEMVVWVEFNAETAGFNNPNDVLEFEKLLKELENKTNATE